MTPRFTLISAIYNVGRYLDDYFRSLDDQTFEHSNVQVILVDDGATDDSSEKIRQWVKTTSYHVTHLEKENGGQSTARNLGLEHALGDWVSFPDPDDILDPSYLERMDNALSEDPDLALGVANLLNYWEATGKIQNTHPLRFRFNGETQVFDLTGYPRNVHLHASSAFFRLSIIKTHGIRFDPRIRPVFEDGHFVQSYLLESRSTLVVTESNAIYRYRRRADNSSTLQTSGGKPSRYTDVLRYGHLDLLQRGAEGGRVPEWLQNAVLYDVFWILRNEESLSPPSGAVPRDTAREFKSLLGEIAAYLDAAVINSFDLIRPSNTQREVLLHGARGESWHSDYIVIRKYDRVRQLLLLTYRYTGGRPTERLVFRGREASPAFNKTRALKYLGETMIEERHLWISSRGVSEFWIDGQRMPIRYSERDVEPRIIRPAIVNQKFSPARHLTKMLKNPPFDDMVTMAMFKNPVYARKYRKAWVFMDRSTNSNDNAEHLFKFVRRTRPEINAFFVLKKGSDDWLRLKREGVDRIVAHGSQEWRVLCLHAALLISSHIDVDVVRPFKLSNGRRPTWNYVFLQHGVTQNDISQWLNSKDISLVISSTEDEFASLAGEGSPYNLSQKDTALTGMPRFDSLDLKNAAFEGDPQFVTVMPTWRKWLGSAVNTAASVNEAESIFMATSFFQQWNEFLSHPELERVLAVNNLRLRFMPHPNLERFKNLFNLPSSAEVVGYNDLNVQDALVSSKALVTDYSSVVFDGAYIGRPTVYFQFDFAEFYAGSHIARPGYFDYDTHGFGPRAESANGVFDGLRELLQPHSSTFKEASARMERTFSLPRHENCMRVMEAIDSRRRPFAPAAAPTDEQNVEAPPTRYLS